MFGFGKKNKTVKQLRKEKGFTARELASKAGISESLVLHTDNRKIRNVPEPLKSALLGVLESDRI